jgi:hypothetical protein
MRKAGDIRRARCAGHEEHGGQSLSMISSFSPPTDNLYKFMALSGLILAFFSYYVPYIIHERLQSRLASAELESKKLTIERDYFKDELDRFDKQEVQPLKAEAELWRTKKVKPSNEEMDVVLKRHDELLDKKRLVDIKNAEVISNYEECRRLARQADRLQLLSYITSGLASVLAFNGFRLWYKKYQVYQDALMEAEMKARTATRGVPE